MNKCINCKWWKWHGSRAVWGDCEKLSPSRHMGELVDVYISGDYMNWDEITFETHPEFGCVMWEAK